MSYLGNIQNINLNYIKDNLSSDTTIPNINNKSTPLLGKSSGNNGFHSNTEFHNYINSICITDFIISRNIETTTARNASLNYSDYFIKMRLNITNVSDLNSGALFGNSAGYQAGTNLQTGSIASIMNKQSKNRIVFNRTLGLKSNINFNTVCNRDGVQRNSFIINFILLKD